MERFWQVLFATFFSVLMAGSFVTSQAAVLFSDDFSDPGYTNAHWGNERGLWTASNGVYNAEAPNNMPPTYSSVKGLTNLTDFVVEVDVNSLDDGGIWLRSSFKDNYENGVLLVTGGDNHTYDGFYWHAGNTPAQGRVEIPGIQGTNNHLRIVVSGNTYSLFLNGGTTPVTTLTTEFASSGGVALYDYSGEQSFDNFTVSAVPLPGAFWLLGSGLVGLIGFGRKRLFGKS